MSYNLKNKKILVTGDFNSVHPGHLRLFNFAKKLGGELIVCVRSNELANHCFVDEKLRLENVNNNSLVDRAFILTSSILEIILKEKPDYIVKGKEFEFSFNEESEGLEEYGGKLVFVSGESIFSVSDYIPRESLSLKLTYPNKYLARHNIDPSNIVRLIKNFKSKSVLVIGDSIIDEYIDCDPIGMSQEDPTLVVVPNKYTKYLGGAGIVASHASGLGSKVNFISVVGNDKNKIFSETTLKKYNVNFDFFIDETRPTILKQRFRASNKTLLRVSKLLHHDISINLRNKILNKIKKLINDLDLIIFSDFNYGCLPHDLIQDITDLARKNDVALTADSQSSSQIGHIERYKNTHLITPTEHEARLSEKNYSDSVVTIAKKIAETCKAKNVLLKMQEEGVFIYDSDMDDKSWQSDQLEALNKMPIDTKGAGDSMLTSSSLALISGANIWEAAYIGSLASGIQVSRPGNIPITSKEMLEQVKIK